MMILFSLVALLCVLKMRKFRSNPFSMGWFTWLIAAATFMGLAFKFVHSVTWPTPYNHGLINTMQDQARFSDRVRCKALGCCLHLCSSIFLRLSSFAGVAIRKFRAKMFSLGWFTWLIAAATFISLAFRFIHSGTWSTPLQPYQDITWSWHTQGLVHGIDQWDSS